MSDLLWVKMPSWFIRENILSNEFSSIRSISTDISALKIYMYLCLYSLPARHQSYKKDITKLVQSSEVIQLISKLTYDEISAGCGLSRLLISRGLRKLKSLGLIEVAGTTRKKIYVLSGGVNKGWCKFPKRDIVGLEMQVSGFHAAKNRYLYELNALKLFMYLLSIRPNGVPYTEVSKGKISSLTNIDVYDIDEAIGFLVGIGFLVKIEQRGYLKGKKYRDEEKFKLIRYFPAGYDSFVRK